MPHEPDPEILELRKLSADLRQFSALVQEIHTQVTELRRRIGLRYKLRSMPPSGNPHEHVEEEVH